MQVNAAPSPYRLPLCFTDFFPTNNFGMSSAHISGFSWKKKKKVKERKEKKKGKEEEESDTCTVLCCRRPTPHPIPPRSSPPNPRFHRFLPDQYFCYVMHTFPPMSLSRIHFRWNARWSETESSNQKNVICLRRLHPISPVINKRAPVLLLKILLELTSLFALSPCLTLSAKQGGHTW